MSIKDTRACIDAILSGDILQCDFRTDELFGFKVPIELPGESSDICNPRESWKDQNAYDKQAKALAKMFKDNYVQYTGDNVTDYTKYGPDV